LKLTKTKSAYSLTVSRTEHAVLRALLKMYPVNNSAPVISRELDRSALTDHQQLLEHYLEDHRLALKKQAETFLPDFPGGKKRVLKIRFTEAGMEAFLQIINDVRIGCWNKLGRFDPDQSRPELVKAEDLEALWAMDMAGAVQSILLHQI
jgi:hypothetical protein